MIRHLTILAATAILWFAAPLAAQDEATAPELGPAVGADIPHDLSLEGSPDIAALSGQNGIALFFIRSVSWCPFCQAQVIDASSYHDDFSALGLKPVYLSYDSAEDQVRFARSKSIQGTFVSDPDSEIIKAFGLLNETHSPGSRAFGIPHPAVFIVTPQGQIVAKLYEDDYLADPASYRDRPAVETILAEAAEALEE